MSTKKRGLFDPRTHKRMLRELLIGVVKQLNGKVAFKGGTAAMMFYGLPRLSVDLDFDIIGELDDSDIRNVASLLMDRGSIKDEENKRNNLFFLFSYFRDAPNVKLEFNKPTWEHNNYIIKQLMGALIRVQDEETLTTNKLVALTDRKHPVARDVFDVYWFLTMGYRPNEELVRERTDKTVAELAEDSITCIKDNFKSNTILDGLGELLDEDQKRWAREHLIPETIAALRLLQTEA